MRPGIPGRMGDDEIPACEEIKLLGLYVNTDGKWKRKLQGNLGSVEVSAWKSCRRHAPARLAKSLYTGYFLATALYGAKVASVPPQADAFAFRMAKGILGLPSHVANAAPMEFLGWLRPSTVGMERRIFFLIRGSTSGVFLVHRCLRAASRKNSSWWSETCALLESIGAERLVLDYFATVFT